MTIETHMINNGFFRSCDIRSAGLPQVWSCCCWAGRAEEAKRPCAVRGLILDCGLASRGDFTGRLHRDGLLSRYSTLPNGRCRAGEKHAGEKDAGIGRVTCSVWAGYLACWRADGPKSNPATAASQPVAGVQKERHGDLSACDLLYLLFLLYLVFQTPLNCIWYSFHI